MMKQFYNKEELDKHIEEFLTSSGFYDNLGPFELPKPDMHAIAAQLESEGYDLDNLVADGHAYEIDGHTNDGWLYEDEVDPSCVGDVVTRKRPKDICKIKGYANYGVLNHEKQTIFTYSNPHPHADVAEEVVITLPEGFVTSEDGLGSVFIAIPDGNTYTVSEILRSWGDHPVMEWYDGQNTHRVKCGFEVVK